MSEVVREVRVCVNVLAPEMLVDSPEVAHHALNPLFHAFSARFPIALLRRGDQFGLPQRDVRQQDLIAITVAQAQEATAGRRLDGAGRRRTDLCEGLARA